jgi:hypothetical protein
MTHPLAVYYLRQAGRDRGNNDISHVFSITPFVQRGHGIGSFLSGLFRIVRPFILSGAKTVGRSNILTDIAEKKAPTRNIVSKHATESNKAKKSSSTDGYIATSVTFRNICFPASGYRSDLLKPNSFS